MKVKHLFFALAALLLAPLAALHAREPPKAASTPNVIFILANDLGETTDLAAQHPEKVKEMADPLQRIRANGRSRP
jgi:hypothetical protein